jgi:hypothetical protein
MGPYPLILLVHEHLIDRDQYRSTADHLASWGYVVVLADFADAPLALPHRQSAADLLLNLKWAQDRGGSALQIDPRLTGAIGHGTGAKLLLMAQAEDASLVSIAALDLLDGEPVAGTADPSLYPSLVPGTVAAVTSPLLLIGQQRDRICTTLGCTPCTPSSRNYQRVFPQLRTAAIEVTFHDGFHYSWLDQPACGLLCATCQGGTADSATLRQLSQALLVAFFELTLRGTKRAGEQIWGAGMPPLGPAGRVSVQRNLRARCQLR